MRTDSVHQRHRRLLAGLMSDEVVGRAIDRAVDGRGRPPISPWRRLWGRIVEPARPQVRLLLQAGGWRLCTIEIGPDGRHRDPDLGRFDLRTFPADPSLPTLAPVLDEHPAAVVVRYRPGKRCTLRIDEPGSATAYVKVFADHRASSLYRDGVALWSAAEEGRFGFDVARPLSFDRRHRSYRQSEVAGRAVTDELTGDGGPVMARRLGRACATIPTSGLAPANEHGPSVELARSRRRAADVAAFVPSLAEPTAALLGALTTLSDDLTPVPLRPIHGSPHPNQWLAADRLGLVDFDRLCLGDPELDVATFMAEIDFEAMTDRGSVADAFRLGYEERHGPLDPRRLLLYRAHKQLAKVHRTVKAVRVDGDERARAHLDVAIATVSEPMPS